MTNVSVPDWTETNVHLFHNFVRGVGLTEIGYKQGNWYYYRPTNMVLGAKDEGGKYYVRTIPFIVWLGRGEE